MPTSKKSNFLVYSYPDHSDSPVLLTHRIETREELFVALASALRQPKQVKRPAPRNYDAMADLLKEAKVRKVICTSFALPEDDLATVTRIFDELGIDLAR